MNKEKQMLGDIMPDTTKPYGYIDMEIERLKYAEQNALRKASDLKIEAETHMMSRIELESALEKQKAADANREI